MSIVNVDCENLDKNPRCAHGPTLKFSRLVKGDVKVFFACSAYRDRKDCPFFLWEGEKITSSKELALQEWKQKFIPAIDHDSISLRLKEFEQLKCKHKHFCLSCFNFVFPSEYNNHKSHELITVNSNSELKHPSKFLFPLTKSKGEAQFWFSDTTLNFIHTNIKKTKADKIICIGTPTLHEKLVSTSTKSILLDIDHRYHWFYDAKRFIWFNMFNFHFMADNEKSLSILIDFLKDGSITVVIDPPFGARTEPLSKTIRQLEEYAQRSLSVFLILPYFMEPQIDLSFPNFVMLDFPVEYTNHKKFKSNKQNAKPSPVRIFTNVNPKDFEFPVNEGYHYCEKCNAWRSKLNKHCDLCKTCPSKNGASYKHCSICHICVKQTWKHCNTCNACCLIDHNCKRKGNFYPDKKKKIKH
uniref:CTCHY-type domain-containing protein n=1 Tax=Riptortus pedestris TaxID=329032 RepID=R4WE43_RIPPE|nr:conserved hypothetical protein [Riptortus pedestris]